MPITVESWGLDAAASKLSLALRVAEIDDECISLVVHATVTSTRKGVRKGGFGVKTPLELNITQKLYYKGSL